MPQSTTNWDALKDIVADALELPVAEREAFLVEKCGSDIGMLEEARELTGASESADGVIDSRTDAWLGLGGPDLLALNGQKIGRYTLEKLIAEGAMAAVYLAQQNSPHRRVALKLVRAAMPLIDSAQRFKREAAALGRLQHPNIARIYEAGVHRGAGNTQAMPFIAMEYVDGKPLNVFARDAKLSRDDRIRLIIKVASAVHAAHQQAVIHRDLKPANVLVDAHGEPKVLDFGIARVIGADDDNNNTWQTTAGVLLGTPGYMSPEQAGGNPDNVDVRSDVWSLGVLLHELLTDRLPIELKNTSIAEILRKIETQEPDPIGKLDPTLRGDLETIVATALAREKDRRYASAEAMASDLRHVLNYEPISARAPSNWYRMRKFARRHRVGLSFAACAMVMLLVGAIVASIGFVRARRERDRAEKVSDFLETLLSAPDPSVASKDTTILQAIRASEWRFAKHFKDEPLTEARLRYTLGWTFFQLGDYDGAYTHLARALELRRAALGPAAPDTIDAAARLMNALRWQDKPAEARKVGEEYYQLALKHLGKEHPSTLAILDPLAGTYSDEADYTKAEEMYRELLWLNTKVLGAGDPQTLTVINNLAYVSLSKGDFAQAEAMFQRLVDTRSKFMKPDNATLLVNKTNLFAAKSGLGKYAECEIGYREIVELSARALGPDHETTLISKASLADTLGRLGRFQEAVQTQREVLESRKRVFGADSTATLAAAVSLGWRLNAAQQYAETEALSREYIDVAMQSKGTDNTQTWALRENLAMSLDYQGKHEAAITLYQAALDQRVSTQSAGSPRTVVLQSYYGGCLNKMGRFDEALPILKSAVETVEGKKITFQEAGTRRNYGVTLIGLVQFDEAERQLLKAWELEKDSSEWRSPNVTAKALVKLYKAWGKPDQVEKWTAYLAARPTTMPTGNP